MGGFQPTIGKVIYDYKNYDIDERDGTSFWILLKSLKNEFGDLFCI